MSLSWDFDNDIIQDFPTVVPQPADEFDPLADAKKLRAAMKGFGADEQAIINILCQRSNDQRQTIIDIYHRTFFRYLIADLKRELCGNFENVIIGLLTPTDKYLAKHLHKAIKNKSHDVLVEILCSRPYDEIKQIITAYEDMYNTSVANEIKKETSGSFQRLLSIILQRLDDQSSGYGDYAYDPDKAKRQSLIIFKTIKEKFADENDFLDIFGYAAQRRRQTYLIFQKYEEISTGKSIVETLKSEMSGVLSNSLLTIVKSVGNRPRYFAERLHYAMKGLGTDDDTLIRIIVSRSEIDLVNIIFEYERIYGKALFNAVKDETSGYYRRSLLTVLGMETLVGRMRREFHLKPTPLASSHLSQQSLGWYIREAIRKIQN